MLMNKRCLSIMQVFSLFFSNAFNRINCYLFLCIFTLFYEWSMGEEMTHGWRVWSRATVLKAFKKMDLLRKREIRLASITVRLLALSLRTVMKIFSWICSNSSNTLTIQQHLARIFLGVKNRITTAYKPPSLG